MMSHSFGLLVEDFNSNYKEKEFKDVVLKTTMDEEELHKLCNIVHTINHYVTSVASPTINYKMLAPYNWKLKQNNSLCGKTGPRRRKLLKCF
jgi:hypothetical protein